MEYSIITKQTLEQHPVKPNLIDYQKMREAFSWDKISGELDWFDKEHINIGHIAIDAHLKAGRGDKKALIWESTKGDVEEYTLGKARFAVATATENGRPAVELLVGVIVPRFELTWRHLCRLEHAPRRVIV